MNRILSLGLLILYVAVMFPGLHKLDALGAYASTVFEFSFVLVVYFLSRGKIGLKLSSLKRTLLDVVLMLVAGFAIYRAAAPLSLMIPFDLKSHETLLFLFLIGPVLEECVFRLAIWELLKSFIRNEIAVLLITTCFFSFAHFFAWWSVPVELRTFVIYQAAYTLFLGFYLGCRRKCTGSITPSILAHMCFNLGFYLGFVQGS